MVSTGYSHDARCYPAENKLFIINHLTSNADILQPQGTLAGFICLIKMALRWLVLHTSARPLHPISLPFYNSLASVSRLFATLTDTSHHAHSKSVSSPLFSHTRALLCITNYPISFVFNTFHTLCTKHPGGGYPCIPPEQSPRYLLTPFFSSTYTHLSLTTGVPCI
jgi:hypothetical protein